MTLRRRHKKFTMYLDASSSFQGYPEGGRRSKYDDFFFTLDRLSTEEGHHSEDISRERKFARDVEVPVENV